jgi:LysR family nod box-dependent transcriptional activator
LRVVAAPLAFPAATQVVQWHPYQDRDPALNWFRQVLQQQAAQLA